MQASTATIVEFGSEWKFLDTVPRSNERDTAAPRVHNGSIEQNDLL
jgi:hypothetical protein